MNPIILHADELAVGLATVPDPNNPNVEWRIAVAVGPNCPILTSVSAGTPDRESE